LNFVAVKRGLKANISDVFTWSRSEMVSDSKAK